MSSTEQYIQSTLHFFTPQVIWIIFGLASAIILMISLALMYHWREYALSHHVKQVSAQKWYLGVVGLLWLVSLGLAITYSTLL